MKKQRAICIVFILVLGFPGGLLAADLDCRIRDLSGTVEVRISPEEPWVPAEMA